MQNQYPQAPKQPKITTYHNEWTLDDPQSWMMDKSKNSMLEEYIKAEDSHANEKLKPLIPLIEKIKPSMLNYEWFIDGNLSVQGPYIYFLDNKEGKFIFYRSDLAGKTELAWDLTEFHKTNKIHHFSWPIPNETHDILALIQDPTGQEKYSVMFTNLKNPSEQFERLDEIFFDRSYEDQSAFWHNDSLFYLDSTLIKFMCHKIRTPQSSDQIIYEEKNWAFSIHIHVSLKTDQYIFLESSENDYSVEVRYVDLQNKPLNAVLVRPYSKGIIYELSHNGDNFYIRSNINTVNFELLYANVKSPNDWKIFHKPDPKVYIYHRWQPKKDYLCWLEQNNAKANLFYANYHDKKPIQIDLKSVFSKFNGQEKLPEENYMLNFYQTRRNDNIIWIEYSSLITSAMIFEYDLSNQQVKLIQKPKICREDDFLKREWVPTDDGEQIPMTIIYNTKKVLPFPAPTVLIGYGSQGAMAYHGFMFTLSEDSGLQCNLSLMKLLDEGFIIASTQVRGGIEKGQSWYLAARRLTKQKTFDDWHSCVKFLTQKQTSINHLGLWGHCCGGLAIGAVMNMDPSSFKCAVIWNPFIDVVQCMMDTNSVLNAHDIDEYGDPSKNKNDFKAMLSQSPQNNVKKGVKYPNILITSGFKDIRCNQKETTKYVAELRNKLGEEANVIQKIFKDGHFADVINVEGKEFRFHHTFTAFFIDQLKS